MKSLHHKDMKSLLTEFLGKGSQKCYRKGYIPLRKKIRLNYFKDRSEMFISLLASLFADTGRERTQEGAPSPPM